MPIRLTIRQGLSLYMPEYLSSLIKGKPHSCWLLIIIICGIASCGGDDNQDTGDPTRFEGEIRNFERRDKVNSPTVGGVVVIGSSSIRLWTGIHNDLQPITIVSRGFGGSTMYDALYYLERIVLPYAPRSVIIYEGDNDIAYGTTPEVITEDFINIVTELKAHNAEIRIFFISIKPSLSRWTLWEKMNRTNTMIKALADNDDSIFYIDVATEMLNEKGEPNVNLFQADQLHLNANGYELWKRALQNTMVSLEQAFE